MAVGVVEAFFAGMVVGAIAGCSVLGVLIYLDRRIVILPKDPAPK